MERAVIQWFIFIGALVCMGILCLLLLSPRYDGRTVQQWFEYWETVVEGRKLREPQFDERAIPDLKKVFNSSSDLGTRARVIAILGEIAEDSGNPDEFLLQLLGCRDSTIGYCAAQHLSKSGDSAVLAMQERLDYSSERYRLGVLWCVSLMEPATPSMVRLCERLAGDPNPEVSEYAKSCLNGYRKSDASSKSKAR